MDLSQDRTFILRSVLGRLWEQRHTFNQSEDDVATVVEEFAAFVDSDRVKIRFQAELLNFRMPQPTLQICRDLTIRQLNEAEISALHGGMITMLAFRGGPRNINEFVLEGEYECQIVTGNNPEFELPLKDDDFERRLDCAILALRTFKSGPVGYGRINQRFVGGCPLVLQGFEHVDLNVPRGQYTIEPNDLNPLVNHAGRIAQASDASMLTACRRLADAETRTRPEDQIFDAVVGMEAILLSAVEDRSELRYRFSINHGALFASPQERLSAFKIAKDLYDLRSKIAHGSVLGDRPYRIGNDTLNLQEVSEKARATLRALIARFLGGASCPYRQTAFWERSYFGT